MAQEYKAFCRRSERSVTTATSLPVRPGRKFHRLDDALFSLSSDLQSRDSLLGRKEKNTDSSEYPIPVLPSRKTESGKRENLFVSEGYANVFAVHNVLRASECKVLVAAGEEFGFENLEGEYPSSYRANERVLLHDPVGQP